MAIIRIVGIVSPVDPLTQATEAAITKLDGYGGKMTISIFIVEDSEALRKRLAAMLQDINGIQITGYADSANQAIEALLDMARHAARPDVAILDIQLLEGNGIDVLKFLRKNSPLTKTIMLTNYSYLHYQKKCAAEGADHFFDKSTEFMKVQEALLEMVRLKDKSELVVAR